MTGVGPATGTLGVRQAAFIGVGAMVGAGIFALLGAAGEVAGAAVWLSFLLAGAVAGLQGYSFAKFGARYPSAGGLLEYVVRGFGDGHVTGVIAWLILAANAIVTGMVAVSFGSYASSAVADGEEVWVKVFAVLVVVAMTMLNVVGSRAVARAQTVVVVVVIGILTVFAVATLANMDPDLLAFSDYPPFGDIVASVALTFFAFLGFGVVTFTAKDLADPSRQLPRALFLALGIATVVYVAVALGVFGTLTVDEVIESGGTALAVAAEPTLGRAGYWMMSVTALFATAGATNAGLYPASGLCDEMASIGQFPPVMGRQVGGRVGTGLVVTAAIGHRARRGVRPVRDRVHRQRDRAARLRPRLGRALAGPARDRRPSRDSRPRRRLDRHRPRVVRLHHAGRGAGHGGGARRHPAGERCSRLRMEAIAGSGDRRLSGAQQDSGQGQLHRATDRTEVMGRDGDDLAELQLFVVQLGAAMNAAGEPVYAVQERLAKIAAAYGAQAATVSAFPTYLMVTMGRGDAGGSRGHDTARQLAAPRPDRRPRPPAAGRGARSRPSR